MKKILNESILDVGCGYKKVIGSVGIDKFQFEGVDIVHDLELAPWPIEDDSFDRIIFCHAISHLQDIHKTLKECHRLLKPGGLLEIVAPHYSSDNFNTDPTHKMHLGIRSMNYFCSNSSNLKYDYTSGEFGFRLQSSSLSFRECKTSWRKRTRLNPPRYLGVEAIINRFPRIYERFFCWIFPVSEVHYLLKKQS